MFDLWHDVEKQENVGECAHAPTSVTVQKIGQHKADDKKRQCMARTQLRSTASIVQNPRRSASQESHDETPKLTPSARSLNQNTKNDPYPRTWAKFRG